MAIALTMIETHELEAQAREPYRSSRRRTRKRPRWTATHPATSTRRLTHNMALLSLFLLSNHNNHRQLVQAQDEDEPTQCTPAEFLEDTCRFDWQLDHFCDNQNDRETSCFGANRDCFDCDRCLQYSYSCTGCQKQEGCYWCPGDAICLSQPLGPPFWTTIGANKITSCPTTNDWLEDSCDAPQDKDNVYNDAYYTAMQWVYDLINVESVWEEEITGKGIHIRINDNGVDSFHPEFIANFNYAGSCDLYQPDDPELNFRGTAAASLAGADANNGACSAGVAPEAAVSSCNIHSEQADAAFVFQSQLRGTKPGSQVDISSNSWSLPVACQLQDNGFFRGRMRRKLQDDTNAGDTNCLFNVNHPNSPCDVCQQSTEECEEAIIKYCSFYYNDDMACMEYLDLFVACEYHGLDDIIHDQIILNIATGRDNKGVIFVVPVGDTDTGRHLGTDTNMNGLVNSRFTIAVAAVDQEGKHASYSTPGAAVLVSAPGGDKKYVSNMIVAKPGGGCHDAGYGTAMAVPIVSGVAALLLEVNNALGWRDVMSILLQTAYLPPALFQEDEWTSNPDGYTHSYEYGFGIVDAAAAVEAARTWVNFPREEQVLVESTIGSVIVEGKNNATTTSTAKVEFINPFFRIETVVVYVDLVHSRRGDLKIALVSPTGTESILASSNVPKNTTTEVENESWKFLTVRNYWEYPGGTWTLKIVDEAKAAGSSFEQADGASTFAASSCVDLEWKYASLVEDGEGQKETLTCADFNEASSCTNTTEINPEILELEFDGRTIFDSCCACGGGDQKASGSNNTATAELLQSWRMVIYGHVSAGGSSSLISVPESTCEFNNDTCPLDKQFDHTCDDNILNQECIGKDCFDCDVCQVFNYDCTSCVEAGCNWCPGDATCMSLALDESFWELNSHKTTSCPTAADWVDTCAPSREENSFEDPLYDAMFWVYEMIDVELVWDRMFTGAGIHVRINDDGVDGDHLELADNYDGTESCLDSRPADFERDVHGTAVASIIAGLNNNGECANGIAPGATISSCVGPLRLSDASNLLLSRLDKVDISVNSWGPVVCVLKHQGEGRRLQQCMFSPDHPDSPCEICEDFSFTGKSPDGCEEAVSKYCLDNYEMDPIACAEYLDLFVSCEYHTLPLDAHESFIKATTEGRRGKGIVFIFSAGNSNNRGADTNDNGFINSRFTISVGAVGKDKKHASYSTSGASVFISAPGGDLDQVSGFLVARPGGGCHDITVGTSFAAPVVAGVVALMLQVNPELGWRDVQGILALTSQDFDPEDSSWVTNAAGYRHSYKFGFGVVKATDALTRASTWKNFDVEKQLMGESGVIDLSIADDTSKIVSSSVLIPEWEIGFFVTESVVVYVDIVHPSRGDLKMVLTSPGGTTSVLHPSKRPENTQLEEEDRGNWKLLSLRTWGEFPAGDWTLSLNDDSPGSYGDCFDLPWEYTYESRDQLGDQTLTCEDFTSVTDCNDETQVNPEVLDVLWDGRTLLQSCCVCGGGQSPEAITPILRSWKLLVYGHVIETLDDYVARPQSPSQEVDSATTDSSTGGTSAANPGTNTGSITSGERPGGVTGNSAIPEGSLTFSPRPAPNGGSDNGDSDWDDRGAISGNYAGGGGTAFMSSNWRGKESVGTDASSPFLDGSSSPSSSAWKGNRATFLSLFVALACFSFAM